MWIVVMLGILGNELPMMNAVRVEGSVLQFQSLEQCEAGLTASLNSEGTIGRNQLDRLVLSRRWSNPADLYFQCLEVPSQ